MSGEQLNGRDTSDDYYASEGQIKRLYAVLYSLGIEPRQWKKEQNFASYARLSREVCSEYIEALEQEEAGKKMKHETAKEEIKADLENGIQKEIEGSAEKNGEDLYISDEYADLGELYETDEEHAESEIISHAAKMKVAVREAVQIVIAEVTDKIPSQGVTGLVQGLALALFRESRLQEERERETSPAIFQVEEEK